MDAVENQCQTNPMRSLPPPTPQENEGIQRLAWQLLSAPDPVEGSITLEVTGRQWEISIDVDKKTLHFSDNTVMGSLPAVVTAAKVVGATVATVETVDLSRRIMNQDRALYCLRQAPQLNWIFSICTYHAGRWPDNIFWLERANDAMAISEETLNRILPTFAGEGERVTCRAFRDRLAEDEIGVLRSYFFHLDDELETQAQNAPVRTAQIVLKYGLSPFFSLCHEALSALVNVDCKAGVHEVDNPLAFYLMERMKPSAECIEAATWEGYPLPHVKAFVLTEKPQPELFPDSVILNTTQGHAVIKKSALPKGSLLDNLMKDCNGEGDTPCLDMESYLPGTSAEAWVRALFFTNGIPHHAGPQLLIAMARVLDYIGNTECANKYDLPIVEALKIEKTKNAYAFMECVTGLARLRLPASRQISAQEGAAYLKKIKALPNPNTPGLPTAKDFKACLDQIKSTTPKHTLPLTAENLRQYGLEARYKLSLPEDEMGTQAFREVQQVLKAYPEDAVLRLRFPSRSKDLEVRTSNFNLVKQALEIVCTDTKMLIKANTAFFTSGVPFDLATRFYDRLVWPSHKVKVCATDKIEWEALMNLPELSNWEVSLKGLRSGPMRTSVGHLINKKVGSLRLAFDPNEQLGWGSEFGSAFNNADEAIQVAGAALRQVTMTSVQFLQVRLTHNCFALGREPVTLLIRHMETTPNEIIGNPFCSLPATLRLHLQWGETPNHRMGGTHWRNTRANIVLDLRNVGPGEKDLAHVLLAFWPLPNLERLRLPAGCGLNAAAWVPQLRGPAQ